MDLSLSSALQPFDAWLQGLRELTRQDLPCARRCALLRLVWQESFLTREGLISRVEDLLGRGCFGGRVPAGALASSFSRDMAAVRGALRQAGQSLAYSRQPGKPGYYVPGRPILDESLARMIAGAKAEVDERQIQIFRRLRPQERIRQAAYLSDWLRQANAYRMRRKGSLLK